MDELIERLGRGAQRFAQQYGFWLAVFVPVLLVSLLPIGSGQVVILVLIFLIEAIAYAVIRSRASS